MTQRELPLDAALFIELGKTARAPAARRLFNDATLRIMLPDGSGRTIPIKAATAVSNGPLTHAIENVGTTEFSEIQVELKDAGPAN